MDYYSLLTLIGAAQTANAFGLGGTISLSEFAVGTGDTTSDQNGEAYDPVETQTTLKNEVYRASINSLALVDGQPNVLEAHCVIPSAEGGWTVRELGLFDAGGNLIAVAKRPPSYKATLAEGAAGDLSMKVRFACSNASAIELKIDPSQVYATQEKVANDIESHRQEATPHPNLVTPTATTVQEGKVELATLPEVVLGVDSVRAVTSAGVQAVYDVLKKEDRLNTLLNAMQDGAGLTISDSYSDPLVDLSGIDTGASSGYTHDAAKSSIHNRLLVESVPTGITSSMNNHAGTTVSLLINGNPADGWDVSDSQNWQGNHMTVDLGAGNEIAMTAFKFAVQNASAWGTSIWTVYGSNDNATFDQLAAGVNVVHTQNYTLDQSDVFTNTTVYRYMKVISESSHNGFTCDPSEISVISDVAQDMTLVLNAREALIEPITGSVLLIADITNEVNVLIDLSKDDGVTWEASTVSKMGISDDGKSFILGELASFSVNGDQTIRSRVRTQNSELIEIHGINEVTG